MLPIERSVREASLDLDPYFSLSLFSACAIGCSAPDSIVRSL